MTDNLSVFVGYLENPHTDIYERGVEAAKHMRECLAGARTAVTMVKVPLVPPQISLLTAKGPYADLIKYGQTKVGGDILNVSVMAGFAYSDSPKNGLTAVVTARNGNRAGGRRAVARHRQARLGHEGALQAADDGAGRRRAARRLGRPRPAPQGRSSWPTSPTIPAAAGAATPPISCARSRPPAPSTCSSACSTTPPSPPRRTSWAKARSSPPRSTPRNTRNSPCPSTARPRSSS